MKAYLRCPIKHCDFNIEVQENLESFELVIIPNEMELHIKGHSFKDIVKTILKTSIKNFEKEYPNFK